MVPDDKITPPHIPIEFADLTPTEQPAELNNEIWSLVEAAAARHPDFNAVEVYECLTKFDCMNDYSASITLRSVLFVADQWAKATDQNGPPSGW
ncbi:hypothetical protein ACQP2X_21585 [Actinoplanes sp. CA-131856]